MPIPGYLKRTFYGLLLLALGCTRRVDESRQSQSGAPKPLPRMVGATRATKGFEQINAVRPSRSTLRLALVGDEGIGSRAQAVLELVRSESADAFVVLGDFDYEDKPQQWRDMLDALGPNFPWFAVVGNHDVHSWPVYEALVASKQGSIKDAQCHGKPGRQTSCLFRDAQLILSEIGTMGNPAENEEFIRRELALSHAKWKLCLWHKNQHDMQTGAKADEVGWGAYRACEAAGAIIVTGHEHAYARTKTLKALGDRLSGYGAEGTANQLEVGPGKTFVTVSGLGGMSTRPFVLNHAEDTWWGAYLTADRESVNGEVRLANNSNTVGAFFLDLGIEGDESRGRGRFITAKGRVFDDFAIRFFN